MFLNNLFLKGENAFPQSCLLNETRASRLALIIEERTDKVIYRGGIIPNILTILDKKTLLVMSKNPKNPGQPEIRSKYTYELSTRYIF